MIGSRHIPEEVVRFNLELRVVAPMVRVTDLVADDVQLAQRLLLRLGAHPVEAFDLVLHRYFDLLGHQLRLRLGVGGEGTFDELLPERFTEAVIDRAGAGLPARRHVRHSAEGLRVEVKVGLFERMRKEGRRRRKEVEAEVGAQGLDGLGCELRLYGLDELGLRDVELRNTGRALQREVVRPIECRGDLAEFAYRHHVICVVRIASLHPCERCFG